MCYYCTNDREIFGMSKELFAAAKTFDAEAEAIGLDPTFYLAEIRRDEARLNGDEERCKFLSEVCDVMKTIEFSGASALYVLS